MVRREPIRVFLERVGADLHCQVRRLQDCADDYYGSIDMASALHPQTLLATKYAERGRCPTPLAFRCGCGTAIKLGFKNPKWITAIEVTNTYPGGYWENLGFNWFSGI